MILLKEWETVYEGIIKSSFQVLKNLLFFCCLLGKVFSCCALDAQECNGALIVECYFVIFLEDDMDYIIVLNAKYKKKHLIPFAFKKADLSLSEFNAGS